METKKEKTDKRIRIVLMDGAEEIGEISLFAPVHIEEIFIAPGYRNGYVMKKLVDEAEKEAKELGLSQVLAFGMNPEMDDYISRLDYQKKPWTVWSKGLQ